MMAAAVLHVCVTVAVYLASKSALLPELFPDSLKYQRQALVLAKILKDSGAAAWLFALLPLHVKLYSLCFLLFGWMGGLSILSFEPLNVLYYLAILYLVYKLSRELFDRLAALLAATIVGLWPSFLIHTTQPLRDPLFIGVALLFFFVNLRWLTKEYSWLQALAVVAVGAVTESLLWLARSEMWELMIGVAFVTCVLLIVRLVKERSVIRGNLVGAVLLLIISAAIQPVALQFYGPALSWASSYGVASLNKDDASAEDNRVVLKALPNPRRGIDVNLPTRISLLRERFILSYPEAGSNIDTGVQFSSTLDIIRSFPTPASIWSLARLLRRLRPDVIQGWMPHGNLAAQLAGVLVPARVAVLWNIRQSLYSLDYEKPLTAMAIKLGAWLSGRPAGIIYNSRTGAAQHSAFGYRNKRSLVIYNGFDTELFSPSEASRRTGNTRPRRNSLNFQLSKGQCISRTHFSGWHCAARPASSSSLSAPNSAAASA
ncbi:MAG TPA: glycosyltransferase [Pyrinomonadaceae bacterium]